MSGPAIYQKGLRVTVEDLEAGTREVRLVRDDFLLLTHGNRYLDGSQWYANGTVQLTIKYSPPINAEAFEGQEAGS